MKMSSTKPKLQEFQVQNKRRQLIQLDKMIDEFKTMIIMLEEQIAAQTGSNATPARDNFAHMNFVKAMRKRHDNLRQSLKDLEQQREHAITELAEIEADHQRLAARQQMIKRTNYSASAAMV